LTSASIVIGNTNNVSVMENNMVLMITILLKK
jgi:hypothetical protein